MTPKEKAEEIVGRFTSFTDEDIYCSLVCVDEILKLKHYLPKQELTARVATNSFEYWQEVKEEIEKLL